MRMQALLCEGNENQIWNNNLFPFFPIWKRKRSLFSKIQRCESEENENKEAKRSFPLTILKKVTELGEGVGFGEIALINKTPRSASIATVTECTLAVLSK